MANCRAKRGTRNRSRFGLRRLTKSPLVPLTLFPDGKISADTIEELEELLTGLGRISPPTTVAGGQQNAAPELSQDAITAVLALIAAKQAELLEAEKVRDEAARQLAAAQAEVDSLHEQVAPMAQSLLDSDQEPMDSTMPKVTLH